MIRPLLACCCAALLPTAELVVRDVRLGLSSRPTDFDFELKTSTSNISGSDRFDGGLSLEGGLRWSFASPGHAVGLVVGADLALDGQAYDDSEGLGTAWGRVAGGVGWAITDRVTATAELLAGFGLSRLELPATPTATRFTADGTAFAYEARIGATVQVTRRAGVGLHLGWLFAEHDLSGEDSEVVLDQSGWYAGLALVWRLDDAPPPLQ